MIVVRKSVFSGVVRERDLPITEAQYCLYLNGAKVQDAFPNLDADDREFILTGITAEEWNETFNMPEYNSADQDTPAF